MKKFLFIFSFMFVAVFYGNATTTENSSLSDYTVVNQKTKVSFTLRNNSMKSIPLKIPNVMNPNLSPMSNSGVTLVVGQKILFKANGKKQLLLVVTEDYEGTTLDVGKLIKERKKELGL